MTNIVSLTRLDHRTYQLVLTPPPGKPGIVQVYHSDDLKILFQLLHNTTAQILKGA